MCLVWHATVREEARKWVEKLRGSVNPEAVALRTRIQDPKAEETHALLRRIQEAEGGDGP